MNRMNRAADWLVCFERWKQPTFGRWTWVIPLGNPIKKGKSIAQEENRKQQQPKMALKRDNQIHLDYINNILFP